jgi:hypothetical protein
MGELFKNLDDDHGIFFEKELEAVKTKTYDVLYPELLARSLFPVDSTTDTGANTVTYQSWDHVGMARLLSNYSVDLPNVEILAKEITRKIYGIGVAYGYSVHDVRSARMAGKPLEQRKANAARRQCMQLENKLAFEGDPKTDIPAFIGHPAMPVTAPTDSVSGSTKFVDKSPDEILLDFKNITATVRDGSNGVEAPDTVMIPELQYTHIATTPRSSTSDTSILDYILKSNPFIKEIIPVYNMKNSVATGGGGGAPGDYDGSDALILYTKNPDKIWLETPQDFEQFPAQEDGLMFEIPCHMRTAGVILAYPLSATILKGI